MSQKTPVYHLSRCRLLERNMAAMVMANVGEKTFWANVAYSPP